MQPDGSVHFVPSRAPTQTEIVGVAAEVGLRRRGYFGGEGSEGLVIEEQTAIEACVQVGERTEPELSAVWVCQLADFSFTRNGVCAPYPLVRGKASLRFGQQVLLKHAVSPRRR